MDTCSLCGNAALYGVTSPLQTIVETTAYLARVKDRLSAEEQATVVGMVAQDPGCGVHLGSGLFKVRFAAGGRGKSGGVRVIYFYRHLNMPVFLLTVFAKNEKANLTAAESAALIKAAERIAATYTKSHRS